MGHDRWYLHTERDKDGNVTHIDLYPEHRVPKARAEAEAQGLVHVCTNLIAHLKAEGSLLANDEAVIAFGKSKENPTKGRRSIEAPITDDLVKSLLGSRTTPAEMAAVIRAFLKRGGFVLPRDGNGLSVVYEDLQYRLWRGATFEHKKAARRSVALLRSLDKLACADWPEQRKVWVRAWAELVCEFADDGP